VILLGGLGVCDAIHWGGTQYAKVILNGLWGLPPELDLHYEKSVQEAIREIIQQGLAESAHDLSDGGLAVALAECSFGPAAIGAAIDLDTDLRPEFALFHEGPSRILLSTSDASRVLEIASKKGVHAIAIGATMRGQIRIANRSTFWVDCSLKALQEPWETSLSNQLLQ
jgi:phosphoribosylformylglycinamidine synthase